MKKSLDTLFSEYIRRKHNWLCERCGKHATGKQLHCSHITTRTYLTTRWEEVNANCLCATCHAYFHAHPAEYGPWLDSKWPGRRKEIQELLNTSKVKPRDFPKIREELKEKLRQLPPD